MARERVAPAPPPQSSDDPPDRGRSRVVPKKVISKKGNKVRKPIRPRLKTKSDNSLSRSRKKEKENNRMNEQLKRNNTIMAKVVNRLKEALASKEEEIMNYKNEIMGLNEEISILRVELENYEGEDGGYVQNQKAVKNYLNNAIDSFLSFQLTFNDEVEKAYGVLNHGLKAARLSRSSRSRSSGLRLTSAGRESSQFSKPVSRESSQFSKPVSPNKQLPQNKVSPMVAGHPITRPRIHLTRVAMPTVPGPSAVDTANDRLVVQSSSAARLGVDQPAPTGQRNSGAQRTIALDETLQVDEEVEGVVVEDVDEEDQYDHHVQSRVSRQQLSPEPPRRTAFDMTVIREESYIESSPETPTSSQRINRSAVTSPVNQSIHRTAVYQTARSLLDAEPNSTDEENESMELEVEGDEDVNEMMEVQSNTSANDEGLNSSFKRRPFSSRRSRPILSSYAIANSLKSSLSDDNQLNIPTEFLPRNQLGRSPQVDMIKSKRHCAVLLSNVSSDSSAMSQTANLEALSPASFNRGSVINSGDSRTGLGEPAVIDLVDDGSTDDDDIDQSQAFDISHAIKVNSSLHFGIDHNLTLGLNSTLTPTSAVTPPVETSSAASSRSSSPAQSSAHTSRCRSPGSQTDSGVLTPRIDTSSISFLESLEYDPMEGPSWLFESLKKKKRRKSGTSGGSRKRRKAARRSSPLLLDSPQVSGSQTPGDSSENIDTSKFLSGLKPSKSMGGTCDNPVLDLSDDENMSQYNKVPRRLSLDSSCFLPAAAGGRTPLREITLEPQGEVLTYNPKVDSGVLVQNIRKSRISIRNTRTSEEHQINETTRTSLETRELRTSKEHEALKNIRTSKEHEIVKNTRTSQDQEVLKNRRSRRSIDLEEDNVQNIETTTATATAATATATAATTATTAAIENDSKKRSLDLSVSDNNEKITKGSRLSACDLLDVGVSPLQSSFNGEKVFIRTPTVTVSNVEVRRSRASYEVAKTRETENIENPEKTSRKSSRILADDDIVVLNDISRKPVKRLASRASRKRTINKVAVEMTELAEDIEDRDIEEAADIVQLEDEKNDVVNIGGNIDIGGGVKVAYFMINSEEHDDLEDTEDTTDGTTDDTTDDTTDPLTVEDSQDMASLVKRGRGKSLDVPGIEKASKLSKRAGGKSADCRLNTGKTFNNLDDEKPSAANKTKKPAKKSSARKNDIDDDRSSTKSADTYSNHEGSDDDFQDKSEGGRRPSRRAVAAKTSYAEPSLRQKMRQGDPGSSSVDPTFVPQPKKKTKQK